MSCCGLLPALRQKFRRGKPKKSDKAASMTEDTPRQTTEGVPARVDDGDSVDDVGVEYEEIVEDEPEGPRMSPFEYVATGYCGLCRTQLPHNPLPLLVPRTEPWEQWERNCRAVFCADAGNESDHIITPPFLLQDEDFERSVTTPVSHPNLDAVAFQLKVPLLDNYLAYVFHSWCYDVLKSKTKATDPETVYRLAKSLSHEASPWETIGTDGDGWLDPPSRIGTLIGDLNDERTQKLQPGFLSRLPSELRAPIWNFVGMRSAYSSFLLVSEETSRLIPELGKSKEDRISIAKGDYLNYEAINLFGTFYIKTIDNKHSETAIEIKEDVESIKVVASLPGVCAIKLVGQTWETEWLGQVPSAGQLWYGTLKDLKTTLTIRFTDLTLLDIFHKDPPQLMWDRPDFPPYLVERDQLKNEATWLRWQSPSRFEFIRHLPLFCGKEPANGLTFYCNTDGIIGIASHFSNTTFFSGYRDGTPTYVSLQAGEGLKNLWYRLGINQMDAPGFVIQTTKNRTYHIGPYMNPASQALMCRWASLNTYSYSSITSIFYQNPRREIFCCAVHGNPMNKTSLPRDTYFAAFPTSPIPQLGGLVLDPDDMGDFERHPIAGKGLFLSVAKLDNVKYIQACRVGSRIVGLLFTYQDGSKTALGQWYAIDTYAHASHDFVYESSGQGGAIKLSFRLEGPQGEKIVTGVDIVTESEPSKEVIGLEATDNEARVEYWQGQSIAWWYSLFYDHLALWQETYHDVGPAYHISLETGF